MSAPFYVTTPIYYVNSVPHLGTFYTTVVADALARFHRARQQAGGDAGGDTFFLTGLDEHGQRIERIAREKGIPPKEYCDGVAAKFQATWKRAEISNDDFIRTTEERHRLAVTEMWRRMANRGDIYAADYEGLYCDGCEEFKPDDDLVVEGGQKVCPTHRRPVETGEGEELLLQAVRLPAAPAGLLRRQQATSSGPSPATTRWSRSCPVG